MLDAAREARTFLGNLPESQLVHDRKTALAIVKELEIIGEAASQLADETKARMPDTPWPDVINMRHRLIHAYFDINLKIVWRTVTDDLPPLIGQLEQALGDVR